MAEKTPEQIALERIKDAAATNADTLSLSNLQLTRIPEEIGILQNLTSLYLSNNNIETLPVEIFQLRNLAFLYLSNNRIKALPEKIGLLDKLEILYAPNNQIDSLPPQIGNLRKLKRLILGTSVFGGNKLTSFPAELGQLSKLEILEAPFNEITTLPPEIGALKSLLKINLSNNLVQSLPIEITRLKKLSFLILHDNPINIPPEILQGITSPRKIFAAHFGSIVNLAHQDEISVAVEEKAEIAKRLPLQEAKVLLVGQGSVGKTSLVQRIVHNTYDKFQPKTEGIAIEPCIVERPQKNDPDSRIKLNIWDFGGQEIMFATHQFFLTKRSLYLLVIDARLTQEENRVEYWLKIIQSFGGESPVLIVGNKTDQHPLDIDRTGLQKKYSNIVGILETSAETGAGIQALRTEIATQVDRLPHVRDLLPKSWFTIKSKLEELGRNRNFITEDEYLSLCSQNAVTDETSQRTLIGFLHDLGVVLHFQDDPRLEALGILNPQWVTSGVYKILNSHELFQNQGRLTLPILNRILNLPEYPSNKRLFIVDMMKKFELCYDIENDKIFLVPDLLPKEEIYTGDWKGALTFQYHYNVLPSSIITRFIVRMSAFIFKNTIWRSGVVLKIGDNHAVVKADLEDKKILIYIDGPEHKRRDALAAIRYPFNEIHSSIKGLTPQAKIPIPDAPNADPLGYDYLLQLERDGFNELPVKEGDHLVKVDVRKLLGSVESKMNSKEPSGRVTNIHVHGDVTGSNIIVGDENSLMVSKHIFGTIYKAIQDSDRDHEEKSDLLADIDEIKREVEKTDGIEETFLSRRLRNLKKIAPDIADIALSALTGPGTAISAIAKKVAERIKEEDKSI